MYMDIANPSTPVPGTEQNVPASESGENANNAASLKDIVKQATGRDYPSDEAALEGIKDTYKAVTSRQSVQTTTMAPQTDDRVIVLEQQLKATNFYADHPEYKDVKGLISKFGSDPEQVIKDPEFVKAYSALKAVSEPQENKSVLTSNNRIAMPQTDDRAADLQAMREGKMTVADYMAKYKGVPIPS